MSQPNSKCDPPAGYRGVDVRELHEDKEACENISDLIGYILKHPDSSTLRDDFETRWPIAWKARYYTWLYSRNRGLQPLQVSLGPKLQKLDDAPVGPLGS